MNEYRIKYGKPKDMPYPNNLVAAINNETDEELAGKTLTIEQESGLRFLLCKLDKRELDIILYRYEGKCTLEEVGRKLDLSRERIRQIEREVIRKLYYEREIVNEGLDAYIEKQVQKRIEQYTNAKLIAEYIQGYKDGIEDREIKYNLEFPMLIDDLDLSCRTYNCLSRYGCRTVVDVIAVKKPIKIRNMGMNSCKEVAVKLQELGIRNTVWDEWLE